MSSLKAVWSDWRWALFAVAVMFLIISTCTLYPDLWRFLGVGTMVPGFVDMEAVLAAGEAWAAGYDPYVAPNLFDSFCRPHIYGPEWLITGAAGFTVAHVAEFSVLTLAAFFYTLGCWYRPTNWRTTAGVLAALLSAPVLLGLERANNDLVVVVLIAGAAVLSNRKGLLSEIGVIVLLATCAWLKLYPAITGLALLTLAGGLRAACLRVIFWSLLTGAGFVLYAPAYIALMKNVPAAQTIFCYDLKYALIISLRGVQGLKIWTWCGTLLAVLLALKIIWPGRRLLWSWLPLTGSWAFFTVSSAATWVGCLVANPSYPYRAVWLLPLLAWAACKTSTQVESGAASRVMLRWIMLFLWMWWVQWQCHFSLIDRSRFEYLPAWAMVLGLVHASVVLTTGIIAWVLLGWLVRRLAEFVPDRYRWFKRHHSSSAANS